MHDDLLIEAHKINYRLRSTFFYRKLIEFGTYGFSVTVSKLIPLEKDYDWENYSDWGISSDAFGYIRESSLSLVQVFTHPRIIQEHPPLIAYYRNVAALSQKSVQYLAKIQPNRFETRGAQPSDQQTFALARLFNEHISLIIENALQGYEKEHLVGMLFASTGAQIDGSWRNAIGDEAEKVVQKMLIKEAIDRNLLSSFLLRVGNGIEVYDAVNHADLDKISLFRGFALKNRGSVLFSSEPDLSLLDRNGKIISVIEVKGGTDPAGALERYGAAKKSFEEALRHSSDVITILAASCITKEVETRIKTDPTITVYKNLTAILTIEEEREWFTSYIFDEILK